MKKQLLFLMAMLTVSAAHAQSYVGYSSDNYAGIHGALFNPASIVDSRFKTDINLFSINTAVGNDLYGVKITDVFKNNYDFETQSRFYPSAKNNAVINVDFLGPSFMFNLAPKHAIAVFTRVRSFTNVVNANGNLIDEVKEGLSDANSFAYAVGSLNTVSNTWGEVGLSYAGVILNKRQNFLKGGFTIKYLQGGVNGYANTKDLSAAFVKNSTNPDLSVLATNGLVTIGGSQDFENNSEVEFDTNSSGLGFDLGFQYEWRPNYDQYDVSKAKAVDNKFKTLNKYKLRFGFSITDIGSINYSKAKQDTYNVTGAVTQKMIDDIGDVYEFLNANYTKVSSTTGIKTNLPTALHANVDWHIHNKFYLNLNSDISLVNKTAVNTNSIANAVVLTPRFETRWFTYAIPVSYMQYTGTQVGSSLRFGPLFVGSSSVLTNLVSSNSKGLDFYLGFKYPVFQKKFKDRDGDDVLDKLDKCPKVAGPIENKGCPWPDTDGDLVVDKDDKCPTEVGPVENNGCPWGDADKDTLLDNVDACPTVAGPVENKGCPWPDTDGDSVLDKDDKCPNEAGLVENAGCPIYDADKDGINDKEDECPTVAGPASNKGCPEVTKEVLKELKVQARAVFFVTGKAVLQNTDNGATDGRLDAIKEIIKNYPNAKFSIEGHTDNVGNPKSNQKLSEARAKVVMDALVAKGVNPANLTYVGYGATKPVASNKTAKGRAENRRTEVIHVGTIYEGKL